MKEYCVKVIADCETECIVRTKAYNKQYAKWEAEIEVLKSGQFKTVKAIKVFRLKELE